MGQIISNFPGGREDIEAEKVSYDNANSKLTAENVQEAIDELKEKATGAVGDYIESELKGSKWTEKEYSFEELYASSLYDIEIQPNNTCTEDEIEAWGNAVITGSSSSNIVKALGDVPKINIPIIIKIVKKVV